MSSPTGRRVVVVTGGGSRLSRALADRFAADGDTAVLAGPAGWTGVLPLDPDGGAAADRLADRVVADHGRLDAWVNHHPWDEAGAAGADLETALRTVVVASLAGARAAHRVMAPAGGGVVVNLTTVDAWHSVEGRMAEGVAAAALVRLTAGLGVEWARSGVRVVGVATGAVLGEPAAAEMPDARIPLRRPAAIGEVVEAVVYLAGPEASYVTGETLRVDGGWSAYQLF